MFDIAFSELVVIMLVALIVIGPERLPKVARTAGHLWGRAQRFVNNVKNDITNDIAIEEARKLHDNIIQEVDAVGRAVQEDGRTLQQQLLQAQYQKPPAAADEQPPSLATSSAPGKPDENAKTSHS
jgi:sec-independent protein translocase protein TatB